MTTLGEFLRQHRLAAGLTQEELAEAAQISVYSISNMEREIPHQPRRQTLILLADALNLSAGERANFLAFAQRPLSASPRVATHPQKQTLSSRLPQPRTPLIGREQELKRLASKWESGACRLLTITGPGGVGKTRLLLAFGQHLDQAGNDRWPDGVLFVSLLGASSLLEEIAASLQQDLPHDIPLFEAVCQALGDRACLLLLDNGDLLLEEATLLGELLERSPHVAFLVTCRSPLHLQGEHLFPLAPLALPTPAQTVDLVLLAHTPAVTLLLDRVQSAHPQFQLTLDNASACIELCRSLDGLPLAIELIAPWFRHLSPQAVLAEWQVHHLQMLRHGAHDLVPHHQALWLTIAWSYERLAPASQQIFRLLGLFTNGIPYDGLVWVNNTQDPPVTDLLEALYVLADQSLLTFREETLAQEASQPVVHESVPSAQREPTTPRVHLLETMRVFAEALLRDAADLPALQEAHAQYYVQWLEAAVPLMYGPEQHYWLTQISREEANIRQAMRWADCQGHPLVGLRLVNAMRQYWLLKGQSHEGLRWVGRFLAQLPRAGGAVDEMEGLDAETLAIIALACTVQGALAQRQHDYPGARAAYTQSLRLHQALHQPKREAEVLNNLGVIAQEQCQYEEATDLFQKSLLLRRQIADEPGIAGTLNNLGILAEEQGQLEQAVRAYRESLAVRRHLQAPWGIALTLANLGVVLQQQSRLDEAVRLFQESLRLRQELGDEWGIALALACLGDAASDCGDFDEAQRLLEEALALDEGLHAPRYMATTLSTLGALAQRKGEGRASMHYYREAFAIRRHLGDTKGNAMVLLGMAATLRDQGYFASALRLLQASLRCFHQVGVVSTSFLHRWLRVGADVLYHCGVPWQAAQIWGTYEAHCQRSSMHAAPVDQQYDRMRILHLRQEMGNDLFDTAIEQGRLLSAREASEIIMR